MVGGASSDIRLKGAFEIIGEVRGFMGFGVQIPSIGADLSRLDVEQRLGTARLGVTGKDLQSECLRVCVLDEVILPFCVAALPIHHYRGAFHDALKIAPGFPEQHFGHNLVTAKEPDRAVEVGF